MSDKVLLQDILEFTRDGEWGKEDPFENSRQTRIIRGTDFEDVRIGKVDELPHRHVAERFVEYKELKPFDILIETAGGSKNTPTGRTLFLKPSLFEKVDAPIVCASFARFLRFDDSKVVPEYLFWHLQYLYRNGVLKQYHVQHTGVARFQFTTFKESEYLELPERKTQQKIASILSAFDDLIENNTRRIEILEEMARRIYREWFVHFRYPGHEDDDLVDSDTELGEIPEGWVVKKLDEVIELTYGIGLRKKDRVEGRYPVYGSSGIIDWHNDYHVEGPGVIVGRKGNVGSMFWEYENFNPIDTTYYVETELPLTYAYYNLQNQNFINSDAAVPGLSKRQANTLPVLVPDKEILENFDNNILRLFNLKRVLNEKNEKLKKTRDLLLPKLISGKIKI